MRKIYKKAGNTFILSFLGFGIAFVFQILLGRLLEPEFYGQYTVYLTYCTIFSIVTVMGMDKNLIKEIPRSRGELNKEKVYLKYSIQVSLIIFGILSIFLYFGRDFIQYNTFEVVLLLLLIFIKTCATILDGYLQGKGFIVKVTFLNSLLNNLLKTVIFLLLIYCEVKSLNAAISSFILSEIITLVLRLTIIHRQKKYSYNVKSFLTYEEKTMHLKYSLTVAIIVGVGLILQNIDKIMISLYLDYSDVGIYKVAQNYVSLISIFVTPFVAFWPVISRLYEKGRIEEIDSGMKNIVKIVTVLVVPMLFIFIFKSNELLSIFGDGYVNTDAKLVLIILSFAFLFDAISGPVGSILTMTKYAKLALINSIISLSINIILNLLLVNDYGIVGIAVATGVSLVINNLLCILQVKLILGIFSYSIEYVIHFILLAIGNYYLCKYLNGQLIINNIFANVIIYGIIVYLGNILMILILMRKSIKNFCQERSIL